MNYEAISLQLLESLNRDAEINNYNRQIDPSFFSSGQAARCDYLIRPMMIHTYRGGEKCEPHIRCMIIATVRETGKHIFPTLDISQSGALEIGWDAFGLSELLPWDANKPAPDSQHWASIKRKRPPNADTRA